MFNDSYSRACMKLWIVQKIRFSLLESGWTKPWYLGLVSQPSAKAQEPLARSRGQWQEVDGLLFNPKNSQLVHILSFHSQGVVFLFIFPKQRTMGGPRHGARVWCLGRVPKHRNHWQEVEGLLFSPQNSQLELSFLGYLGTKAQNMHQLRVFGAK